MLSAVYCIVTHVLAKEDYTPLEIAVFSVTKAT